jgi:lipoprotein-releasing system ATP-binding protein
MLRRDKVYPALSSSSLDNRPNTGTKDAMTDTLLSVRNLAKEYPAPGAPFVVLNDVSFELAAGTSLSIMGPSGSGKSTLLNIISSLDAPTRGNITFGGKDVHKLSETESARFRNRDIGFVFQDHHLLPQCTAEENVLLPCLAFGKAGAEQAARCGDLLNAVGLSGKGRHFPAQLSGGERQRVAVARAMINAPRLLLCDEPTGSLDAGNSLAVASLLIELRDKRNVALLVVTHNDGIARLLGRCATLKDGSLHE